jgi:hypothetical protein
MSTFLQTLMKKSFSITAIGTARIEDIGIGPEAMTDRGVIMVEDRHAPCRNCRHVLGKNIGNAEWNTIIYHTTSYSRTGVVGKENAIGIGDGMKDAVRDPLGNTIKGDSKSLIASSDFEKSWHL